MKKTLLAILSISIVTCAAAARAETDNIAVTLTGGNAQTHLSIPREYFSYPAIRSGVHDFSGNTLALDALLPDLKPLPPKARGNLYTHDQGELDEIESSGHWVEISLSQGAKAGMAEVIEENLKKVWIPDADEAEFSGFQVYKVKLPPGLELSPFQKKFLLPADPKWKNKAYMECPVNNDDPSPTSIYCQVHTDFGHMIFGDYTIARAQLKNWESLDEKVKKFVAAFIVADAPKPKADTQKPANQNQPAQKPAAQKPAAGAKAANPKPASP